MMIDGNATTRRRLTHEYTKLRPAHASFILMISGRAEIEFPGTDVATFTPTTHARLPLRQKCRRLSIYRWADRRAGRRYAMTLLMQHCTVPLFEIACEAVTFAASRPPHAYRILRLVTRFQ